MRLALIVFAFIEAATCQLAAELRHQSQFDHLIGTANRLHVETQNFEACVSIIRAAFLVCPRCLSNNSKGHFSEGFFVFDSFPDRRYLSDILLPAVAENGPQQLLWVGVQAYTLRATYELGLREVEVTSIEPDKGQRLYGSTHRHIVAPLQDLLSHVPKESFDAIIINGVIGWGIDGEEAQLAAAQVMHGALRSGGILVVGWNKGMGTCCAFGALFMSAGLQGLPAVYEVPHSQTHHVFETFRRAG